MGSEDDDRFVGASRKIMIVAILSLFSAVFLIILLYFYSRHRLRREARRHQADLINRLRRRIAVDDANSNEPAGGGLDALAIASLPLFLYKSSEQRDPGHDSLECSICLGSITEDVVVRVLPNCKHMFHVECIDMWLGSHPNCPICRTGAEPRVEEPEEGGRQGDQAQPSAPPLEEITSMAQGGAQLEKASSSGPSGSRLGSSFRRMFNRERSRRTRSLGDEVCPEDLERQ